MKAHGFMAITRCAMPDRNINVLMPAVACTHTHAAHSAAERARSGDGGAGTHREAAAEPPERGVHAGTHGLRPRVLGAANRHLTSRRRACKKSEREE